MHEIAANLTTGWVGLASALFVGTLLGFIAGLTPGLGSRVSIIVCLPLAIFWDPLGAAVLLFAMHAVVHTASSIPAIAFALPSTGGDTVTILDGHPLAKMGRGGEALGASLSASALGGVIGSIAFLLAIPVARALIVWFGPPEFLVLALAGLTLVATLSGRSVFTGIVVGLLGLLFSMVGRDVMTSASRLTFGQVDLLDGLQLAAIVGGIFVVPEMLSHWELDAQSKGRAVKTRLRDVFAGMAVTLRYLPLVFRSSLYGIGVGMMPGVGSSVSVWMSYAYAARTVKSDIPFGKGAIAGVIAPETANNAKEGGAMVPTLFFGIPGSSSMAIMLAALHVVGQQIGPNLLTADLSVSLVLAATVFGSNLLAVPLFFAVVPWIVRLTALKRDHLTAFAIATSLFAAMMQDMSLSTLLQFAVGGAVGLILKWLDWPRAPFLLGFVLGPIAEISYLQTVQVWGWSMFLRPATLIMIALFGFGIVRGLLGKRTSDHAALGVPDAGLGLLLVAAFGLALTMVLRLPVGASPAPVIVCILGIAAALTVVGRALLSRNQVREKLQRFDWLAETAGYLLAVPIAGLPLASAGYLALLLFRLGVRPVWGCLSAFLVGGLQLGLLSLVLDMRGEPLIGGWLIWRLQNPG